MTKKLERTGEPVTVAVPWGNAASTVAVEEAADQFEAMGDATPTFAPPEGNATPIVDDKFAERIKAAFTGEPMAQASPFAPKPKAPAAPAPETFDLGDAPSWGQLVGFVQKHGDIIIQVRYPKPLGIAIDTIYRGVTVITHPTTEVRHVRLGWIKWADAQYEQS